MKKIYLLLSFAALTFTANAQLNLTGTQYIQTFDTIGTNLPTGWSCYTGASSTTLGTVYTWSGSPNFGAYYDTTDCATDVFGKGFKNCASGDVASDSTATCTIQAGISDRAFGVRQTGSFGDAGASFVLELANTTNISAITLGFRLQGLDILSSRVTTWTVDYGVGASPTTFTAQTPIAPYNDMVTGGKKFTDTTVVVTFDAGIENQSQPVWIRISTLAKSTGTGNRTTSAIDDVVLDYTNTTAVPTISAPAQVAVKAIGFGTSTNVTLGYSVAKAGQYNIGIYDITGREVSTKSVELTPNGKNISINGLNLVSGMYIARIYNNVSSGTAKVIVQ